MNDVAHVKAKELHVKLDTHDHKSLVPQNNIFALRSGNVNLSRWTRVNFSVNLPSDPWTVFVQVKYPANSQLNVSDNFATIVTIANRSLIQVNVWRVDADADPAIDYQFEILATI